MNRRVSGNFLKDVSTRFYKLKSIVKDTGIELPPGIESTIKRLSGSSDSTELTRANSTSMQEEAPPAFLKNSLGQIQKNVEKVSARLKNTKKLLLMREKENAELKQMISQLQDKVNQPQRCCEIF